MAVSIVESASLRYLLSVPAGQGPFPLLVFLHGYDEGAPAEIRAALTRHGPLRPGSSAKARDFIVVAPQLPLCGDYWLRYAAAVQEVASSVVVQYDGDADRTYLTGFSFGGNGVFDLGAVQRGFWAALWAVDPTRAPRVHPDVPVWISAGQIARSREQAFRTALPDATWVDDGEDHVGSATRAYRDDRVYEWLLARRRP